jgi:hypothetical protein
MCRNAVLIAFAVLLTVAGAAQADWVLDNSWSTTDNSSGPGKFAHGFLFGPEGTFNAFTKYNDNAGFGAAVRWDASDQPGQDTDTRGNCVRNSSGSPYERTDWCNGGVYWETGKTYQMAGQDGSAVSTLWIAPQAGQYQVTATFTNPLESGHDSDVAVRVGGPAENDAHTVWTSTLSGFIGKSINNYSDAFGTNPSATYSDTLTLSAGENLDFFVYGNHMNYNAVGLSVTISQVPEPGAMMLIGSGLVGLLAYAWRKRK